MSLLLHAKGPAQGFVLPLTCHEGPEAGSVVPMNGWKYDAWHESADA
jgi:hypothetical protein